MNAAQTLRDYGGTSPSPAEDDVTKSIERYTAGLPSSGFLAVAFGAIGLALLFQTVGRGKWGNFVAQWVPTLLIMGVYNKLVKLQGEEGTRHGARQRIVAGPAASGSPGD